MMYYFLSENFLRYFWHINFWIINPMTYYFLCKNFPMKFMTYNFLSKNFLRYWFSKIFEWILWLWLFEQKFSKIFLVYKFFYDVLPFEWEFSKIFEWNLWCMTFWARILWHMNFLRYWILWLWLFEWEFSKIFLAYINSIMYYFLSENFLRYFWHINFWIIILWCITFWARIF